MTTQKGRKISDFRPLFFYDLLQNLCNLLQHTAAVRAQSRKRAAIQTAEPILYSEQKKNPFQLQFLFLAQKPQRHHPCDNTAAHPIDAKTAMDAAAGAEQLLRQGNAVFLCHCAQNHL